MSIARYAESHADPEVYPRPDGTVYICGEADSSELPEDPAAVRPKDSAVTNLQVCVNHVETCLDLASGTAQGYHQGLSSAATRNKMTCCSHENTADRHTLLIQIAIVNRETSRPQPMILKRSTGPPVHHNVRLH